MRQLTTDEKAQCETTRKRANKQLQEQRKSIGLQIRKLPTTCDVSARRAALLRQFDAIRDVKGAPVIAQLEGDQIVLDYELFRRLIRTLRNRHVNLKIDRSEGRPVLTVTHSESYYSKNAGKIELYELQHCQQELLSELPVIKID